MSSFTSSPQGHLLTPASSRCHITSFCYTFPHTPDCAAISFACFYTSASFGADANITMSPGIISILTGSVGTLDRSQNKSFSLGSSQHPCYFTPLFLKLNGMASFTTAGTDASIFLVLFSTEGCWCMVTSHVHITRK